MSQYFPKPFRSFGGDVNVKVDLSNYATKADIKNVSHVDTSSFALKLNVANLKTEVDKLDMDKLVPVSFDLSKLSNVVRNEVVKKTVYDKLVAIMLTLVHLFQKLNTMQIKQSYKKKFLIPVDLLKNQIIMLRLMN